MRNKKGFTLIELLAVIVILGLLMAIAIPSVTKYITQSRKKTLVNSIDSFITATTTAVNNNEFGALSNQDVIYYIPVSNISTNSCISLEKGGTNPFGNWMEAYVAVNYNASKYSYDYFFTFYDDAGYGMALTKSDAIKPSGDGQIMNPTPVDSSNITTQLGGRAKEAKVLSVGTCNSSMTEVACEGNGTSIGSLITCGSESFYVISDNSDSVDVLAKHKINLSTTNPVQSSSAGEKAFSSTEYWYQSGNVKPQYGSSYPAFVYDSNSYLYEYVEAYEQYLISKGVTSASATLISYEKMLELGCVGGSTMTCNNSSYKSWLVPGYYWWTGSAGNMQVIWHVTTSGSFTTYYGYSQPHGVRPVINISKSNIKFN